MAAADKTKTNRSISLFLCLPSHSEVCLGALWWTLSKRSTRISFLFPPHLGKSVVSVFPDYLSEEFKHRIDSTEEPYNCQIHSCGG